MEKYAFFDEQLFDKTTNILQAFQSIGWRHKLFLQLFDTNSNFSQALLSLLPAHHRGIRFFVA
jgi:hypothetical protein